VWEELVMTKNKLILLLVLISTIVSAQVDDFETAWNDFISSHQELLLFAESEYPEQVALLDLRSANTLLSQSEMQSMQVAGISTSKLLLMTEKVRSLIPKLKQHSINKATAIDADVSISACQGWTDEAVYGLSITNDILGAVLAGMTWSCEQTVGGFNSALACFWPEVSVQVFAAITEIGDFCISDISRGVLIATDETNRSIVEHLNTLLDEDMNTRASTALVNELATDVIETRQKIDDYFPTYFPAIRLRQDSTALEADDQAVSLLELLSRHQSLQQQQIILNARLVDIDERAADSHLGAEEIRVDTQQILQQISGLNSQLQSQNNYTADKVRILNHDHMVMTLIQTDGGKVIDYRLPAFQGGQLESVRELVQASIIMAQNAGFNISTSQVLFNLGDGAYNLTDYNKAYSNYAKAYLAITKNGEEK